MTASTVHASPESGVLPRAAWLSLIVVGGAGFSLFFACVTPFAALVTLAALNMERRDGAIAVVLAWLANQAVGFGVLGYPLTGSSVAWGGAIGVAVVLGYCAARSLSSSRPVRLAASLPFVAAFAAYELSLYVAGFVLGATPGAFTFAVIRRIAEVNVIAVIGLWAASHLMLALRWGSGPRRLAPSAPIG